jgi:hypothetical protein
VARAYRPETAVSAHHSDTCSCLQVGIPRSTVASLLSAETAHRTNGSVRASDTVPAHDFHRLAGGLNPSASGYWKLDITLETGL